MKLNNCSVENFFLLLSLLKDQSIKIALDSKVLNKSIHKNKYKIPINEKHLKTILQNLIEKHNS